MSITDDRSGGATEADIARLCSEAIHQAAARLRVSTERLARGLGQGRLADLVLELATARHRVQAADRQRIDDLLEEIGAGPGEL